MKEARRLLTGWTGGGGIDIDRFRDSLKTLLGDLPGNEPTDY